MFNVCKDCVFPDEPLFPAFPQGFPWEPVKLGPLEGWVVLAVNGAKATF
jgi:hypothetical protein